MKEVSPLIKDILNLAQTERITAKQIAHSLDADVKTVMNALYRFHVEPTGFGERDGRRGKFPYVYGKK